VVRSHVRAPSLKMKIGEQVTLQRYEDLVKLSINCRRYPRVQVVGEYVLSGLQCLKKL